MASKIEKSRSASPSLVKRGLAALIVIAVGVLVVNVIVGFVHVLLIIVIVVAAVIALGWAANTLL